MGRAATSHWAFIYIGFRVYPTDSMKYKNIFHDKLTQTKTYLSEKKSMKIYDQLTDKSIVQKVNDVFYDKVYDHPWISQYFDNIEKDIISKQQTDFIVGAIGGPKNFSGRIPSQAHPHMFITDELYDLRTALLIEALEETKAPVELKTAWLKIDESFRRVIAKNSPADCSKRWATDKSLNFSNPQPKKKAS